MSPLLNHHTTAWLAPDSLSCLTKGSLMADWSVLFIWWWWQVPCTCWMEESIQLFCLSAGVNWDQMSPLLLKHWNFSDLHESFCFHISVFSLALLLDFRGALDSLCYMFPVCASLSPTRWTDRMRGSQKTAAWSFVFSCSWSWVGEF